MESEAVIPGDEITASDVEVWLTGRFLAHHLWAVQ
jgi:hypothetical protein